MSKTAISPQEKEVRNINRETNQKHKEVTKLWIIIFCFIFNGKDVNITSFVAFESSRIKNRN
jgi:hypothetical protein